MSAASQNHCAPQGRGARGLGHQAPEFSRTVEELVASIDLRAWDRSLALDRLVVRREAKAERARDGGAP